MKFLLDTNICIYIMKERPESVIRRFRQVDPRDVGISIITVAELEYGVSKSRDIQRNREQLRRFCQPFPVVGLSDEDVQVFGEVRANLEQRGLPIGAYDLLIAAQARCRGLVLVTNNVREFERVQGLTIENWVDG